MFAVIFSCFFLKLSFFQCYACGHLRVFLFLFPFLSLFQTLPDDEISRKTVSILPRCVAFIKMNLHINSTDGVKIKRSNLIIILVHHSCLSVYISASSIFSQKPCHKHLSSHATQSLKVGTNLSCAATMLMSSGYWHLFVDTYMSVWKDTERKHLQFVNTTLVNTMV